MYLDCVAVKTRGSTSSTWFTYECRWKTVGGEWHWAGPALYTRIWPCSHLLTTENREWYCRSVVEKTQGVSGLSDPTVRRATPSKHGAWLPKVLVCPTLGQV